MHKLHNCPILIYSVPSIHSGHSRSLPIFWEENDGGYTCVVYRYRAIGHNPSPTIAFALTHPVWSWGCWRTCPCTTSGWSWTCQQPHPPPGQSCTSALAHPLSPSAKEMGLAWKFIHFPLGAVSIRKTVLPGMAIPMLKIRRPNGRLIFNMEIAIRR